MDVSLEWSILVSLFPTRHILIVYIVYIMYFNRSYKLNLANEIKRRTEDIGVVNYSVEKSPDLLKLLITC